MTAGKGALWGVNITGPDDILAAYSRRDAVKLAVRFNFMAVKFEAGATENDPLMWAVPVQWPHDDASHAANLGDLGEYAWLRKEAA